MARIFWRRVPDGTQLLAAVPGGTRQVASLARIGFPGTVIKSRHPGFGARIGSSLRSLARRYPQNATLCLREQCGITDDSPHESSLGVI